MRYPAAAYEKLKIFWAEGSRHPLRMIRTVGIISLFSYAMFATLPFFIPNTDKSHFPPYLALP
jgi:hypothetical protein